MDSDSTNSLPHERAKPPLGWVRWAVGLALLGLVVYGMVGIFRKALAEFDRQQFRLAELNFSWLMASGLLYLLGALACGLFWHVALRDMGQSPRIWETMRAYFVGGLGKYIPGKAMVVVLRAAMIQSPRVDGAVAGISVFVETLTVMAVGAILSAAILALDGFVLRPGKSVDIRVLWIALAAGPVCVIPTLPFVFRRVVRILRVHRLSGEVDSAVAGLGYHTMGVGWLLTGAGWIAMGLSLWATLHAIPESLASSVLVNENWPLAIAGAALAVVAGFLSPLPAGLGIRDFVVMAVVAATYGEAVAVLSGGLLRVVWLVAEVTLSVILYFAVGSPES